MPVRRNIPYSSSIYSITFTRANWLCLFETADAYSSDKVIIQKPDYINNKTCKGKWNLVDSVAEYVHSSAMYYLTGE